MAGGSWRPGAGCRGHKGCGRAGPPDFALWHRACWVWATAQEAGILGPVRAEEDVSRVRRVWGARAPG